MMKDELIIPRGRGDAADGRPPYDASAPSYVCPPIRGHRHEGEVSHIPQKLAIASFCVFPHVFRYGRCVNSIAKFGHVGEIM